MSRTVIQVEGLGKRYRIGLAKRHNALSHVIGEALRAPIRLLRLNHNLGAHANGGSTGASATSNTNTHNNPKYNGSPYIWALKDVSFEVEEGEVVGLIGRNGAGKSTLLKILSRITRPTEGHAEIHGRIGSLLEVGTGFHPELTGRENVFMSGAVLGMRAAEIRRKFDEIVAFSEVERFLDTPLKHYSSGMQMRLAFAVAAHLEPEILFVDEVLAVGDAAFQKKCLGKMSDVARQGRTILFVSHSIAAINALCSRAVMLDHGKIKDEGPTAEITARYYAQAIGQASGDGDLTTFARTGSGKAHFTSISIRAASSEKGALDVPETGCDLIIETNIVARAELPESNVAVIIYDSTGYRLIDVNLNQRGEYLGMAAGEKACVRFLLRQLLLKPGTYFIGLWIGRGGIENIDNVENAATLTVASHAETQVHSIVFPGPYLCRFESSISQVEESVL
jgi:lipopolysaccharide transport system ATP-binding protein